MGAESQAVVPLAAAPLAAAARSDALVPRSLPRFGCGHEGG